MPQKTWGNTSPATAQQPTGYGTQGNARQQVYGYKPPSAYGYPRPQQPAQVPGQYGTPPRPQPSLGAGQYGIPSQPQMPYGQYGGAQNQTRPQQSPVQQVPQPQMNPVQFGQMAPQMANMNPIQLGQMAQGNYPQPQFQNPNAGYGGAAVGLAQNRNQFQNPNVGAQQPQWNPMQQWNPNQRWR